MPHLLRLRFVSIGHPQARMEDLVLDFRDAEGRATDSTLWLRNGGGKSSILNLFFAIVRPHKRDFLGGQADARQRSLEDYVLTGGASAAIAEWQLDEASDALALGAERFLTGVFFERAESGADLRRLFFASRVFDDNPESTLEGLPLMTAGAHGYGRRTLSGFREAWLALRAAAPHLNVTLTESQTDWHETLEAARIDPELFGYQVKMNQREGGADELFRFADADSFINFLLEIAVQPDLADGVGRNLGEWRRQLLERKERLIPEQELVTGLLERMTALEQIGARRDALRAALGAVTTDLHALQAHAQARETELTTGIHHLESAAAGCRTTADEAQDASVQQRRQAALLRCHGAKLRLQRQEEEQRVAQSELRQAQDLVEIWGAAVPLQRVLRHELRAHDYRTQLEVSQREHAPLRTEVGSAANALAAVLVWHEQGHREEVVRNETAEQAARKEAKELRQQAVDAGGDHSRADARAEGFATRLAEMTTRQELLVQEELLLPGETAVTSLQRWEIGVTLHNAERLTAEEHLARLNAELEQLQRSIEQAADTAQLAMSNIERLSEQAERATIERQRIETDAILLATLELEGINADQLAIDTVEMLEQAARMEQRSLIETRLTELNDERTRLHLEEEGLHPPTPDVLTVLTFLKQHLAGRAWSGWSWIAENVPATVALDVVRAAPLFAQGVVVRSDDFDCACTLLRDGRVEPDGPVLLVSTDALETDAQIHGAVLGPNNRAWFDKEAAQQELLEFQQRLAQHQENIAAAETHHRKILKAAQALRTFREYYPRGWFQTHERTMEVANQRLEEAKQLLAAIRTEYAKRDEARTATQTCLQEHEKAIQRTDRFRQRLQDFIADYVTPSLEWEQALQQARSEAARARAAVTQNQEFADEADFRAGQANTEARVQSEEARLIAQERAGLKYVEGKVIPVAADPAQLRDRYRLLCDQYEGKVNASHLTALAEREEAEALRERNGLSKRLSSTGLTEEAVRSHLDSLHEHDQIEQVRDLAQDRKASLLGKLGSIGAAISATKSSLQLHESKCQELGAVANLSSPPESAEDAESIAMDHEREAAEQERIVAQAQQQLQSVQDELQLIQKTRFEIEALCNRLQTLLDDYSDLLSLAASSGRESNDGQESFASVRQEELGERLRQARLDSKQLDDERSQAIQRLRAWATSPRFGQLPTEWLRQIQDRDEPTLEQDSAALSHHLRLRQGVLADSIAEVDRHRAVLVHELQIVADKGIDLLRQADSLSKLPQHLPVIGGAHFLRITTQTPTDADEQKSRLAQLIDELVEGKQDLGGIRLVQAAVRRLARPIQVRVLHPDPSGDRRMITIQEMAKSSGGEQLTAAILLYCTLARIRGRSRGQSRRATSVLLLDNPIGRASRPQFLELQREVARAMGVQLIYTTGVNDHEAIRALPNIIRLRNERVDKNSGRRLVEHGGDEMQVLEAVRIGRRESRGNGPLPIVPDPIDAGANT